MASWLPRLAGRLGPVTAPRALGGRVWRVNAGGQELVCKVGAGVLDEAVGLRRLGRVAGAPPVPEVVLVEPDLLVTTWVEQGGRTTAQEEALGRTMAVLHSAPWAEWGGGSSWIGDCPVDPQTVPDGATFYTGRLRELAARCGLERPVAALADRMGEMLPPDGPVLVHGDLWWGNVLWGADGRPWLIDPSVHGGHPEEDLAMLALFGPLPDRLVGAYAESRALHPGWERRVELFQLCPLLVHTVLFGGGYRARVETVLGRLA